MAPLTPFRMVKGRLWLFISRKPMSVDCARNGTCQATSQDAPCHTHCPLDIRGHVCTLEMTGYQALHTPELVIRRTPEHPSGRVLGVHMCACKDAGGRAYLQSIAVGVPDRRQSSTPNMHSGIYPQISVLHRHCWHPDANPAGNIEVSSLVASRPDQTWLIEMASTVENSQTSVSTRVMRCHRPSWGTWFSGSARAPYGILILLA